MVLTLGVDKPFGETGSTGDSADTAVIAIAIASLLGVVALFASGHPVLGGILLVVLGIAALIYFIRRKG